MQYQVVFEISDNIFNEFSFVLSGFLFIIIGALFIKYRKFLYHNRPKLFIDILSFSFFGFSLFWTITSGYTLASRHYDLLKKYQNKEYEVVEGIVKNFDPMPPSGHKMESFTVGGKRFEYSDYIITAGFNKTSSHGGPISEGLKVRISYIADTIIKLEVATDKK